MLIKKDKDKEGANQATNDAYADAMDIASDPKQMMTKSNIG